jgi:dienelactone hydrolase
VVCLHGGSGGLGIAWLVDTVLNQPLVFDRLLAEGYAVAFTEGRREIEWAYGTEPLGERDGGPAQLDHQDVAAVFRYMRRQPFVDPARVGFFGTSHGGELQMKLISELGEGPAALVPAEPAVIEYLGLRHEGRRAERYLQYQADLPDEKVDVERALARIGRIPADLPILVLGRDEDHLQGLFRKLHELLVRAGKRADWASWSHREHAYHWGPRRGGQPDSVQRETLDRVVAFLNEHVREKERA